MAKSTDADIGPTGADPSQGATGAVGDPGATGAVGIPDPTGPTGTGEPVSATATTLTPEQLTDVVARLGTSVDQLNQMASKQVERPDNTAAARQARRAEIEQIATAQGADVKTTMLLYDIIERQYTEMRAGPEMEREIASFTKGSKSGISADEITLEMQQAYVTPEVWGASDANERKVMLEQAELLALGRQVKAGQFVRKSTPPPPPPPQTPGPGQSQVQTPDRSADTYVPDAEPDFEHYVQQQMKFFRGDRAKAEAHVRKFFKKTRGGQ